MFTPFTPYRIALARAPAGKPYGIRLLFTHKHGDFRAISVTERSCDLSITKVAHYISDLSEVLCHA